ncbi:adenosylcobinamide-phosphate synthase CbiB [Dyadobacter chenwenxiniae]|uniref:Cobalamin biosynthesis protein CobD n=1 Tax=Dyadobacter chenwenxiniae TaxID=2906456 RepID=A0A9X1PPI0_9BACT|nr:adenosylcobinamide-phosphate synthase CbiB [Dyadobacter chenwenxiniae]MCF0063318.1 adenosylcobinamide-phosphate synthase CbiB [Dyadobacter chenwenxiniae]UON85303.1 adenosylcobinamide-phosphate synthase CbiB [Dyadobacter chenwenxiniae]
MENALLLIVPLCVGYLLDLLLGDPDHWPHPVRLFGDAIALGERNLNHGGSKILKGALLALCLVLAVYFILTMLNNAVFEIKWLFVVINSIWVYYGLANKNLVSEGQNVFDMLEKRGLSEGRAQLSRIVGRDTIQLSEQQIRTAVFETMSENLSDGVVAPLFYYALAGAPGMMAYKMINTMDSMIGYHNARYEQFGKFAARLDDAANFIPARITALLMVLVTGSWRGLRFIFKYGNKHKSPNAGYPESALAGILHCRFGGPNVYHGVLIDKPYIGENGRRIRKEEIRKVSQINHLVCLITILLCCIWFMILKI